MYEYNLIFVRDLGISEQSLNAHRHFPLLCRLACHQFDLSKELTQTPGLNLSEYFLVPFDFYKNKIRSLQLESPLSYCVLVLCTLFNGKLPKRTLSTSRQYADLVEDCCESCGLNRGTSRIKLLEKVASLENVYLSQNEDEIVFVHDFLMDIVSKYTCDDSPSLIITHSSAEFIRDRVACPNYVVVRVSLFLKSSQRHFERSTVENRAHLF
jgi:hypothetical protein